MTFFVAALLFLFAWQGSIEPKKAPSIRDRLPPSLLKEIQAFEEEYELAVELVQSPFTVSTQGGGFHGQPVKLAAIAVYLPIILKEWRLYPPRFLKKLHLARIFVCSGLCSVTDPEDGWSGVVDIRTSSVYYDVSEVNPDWLSHAKYRSIHHELFHCADHRIRSDIYLDPVWEKLNAVSFVYFHLKKWDKDAGLVTSLFPGFITRYAEDSVAEDKAETFGCMMHNLHEMECRAKDDVILSKKIEHLKRVLKEYCPEINESFWSKMRHMNRPRLTHSEDSDPWAIAHPTLPTVPPSIEPAVKVEDETRWMPTEQSWATVRRRCRCPR